MTEDRLQAQEDLNHAVKILYDANTPHAVADPDSMRVQEGGTVMIPAMKSTSDQKSMIEMYSEHPKSNKVFTKIQDDEIKAAFDLRSTNGTIDTKDLEPILKSMGVQPTELEQILVRVNTAQGGGLEPLDFHAFSQILKDEMPKSDP